MGPFGGLTLNHKLTPILPTYRGSWYVNSDLKEVVNMEQPTGFICGVKQVLLLKKSVYVLKQSANTWNKWLNNVLTNDMDMTFKSFKTDPCIYSLRKANNICVIAIYVDDIMIFSNSWFYKKSCVILLRLMILVRVKEWSVLMLKGVPISLKLTRHR